MHIAIAGLALTWCRILIRACSRRCCFSGGGFWSGVARIAVHPGWHINGEDIGAQPPLRVEELGNRAI